MMLKKLAELALMMSTLVQGGGSYDSMFGISDPCGGVNFWDSTNPRGYTDSWGSTNFHLPESTHSGTPVFGGSSQNHYDPFDDDLFFGGAAADSFHGAPSANKPKVINLIYNPGGAHFTDMPDPWHMKYKLVTDMAGPWHMEYKLVRDQVYAGSLRRSHVDADPQGFLDFLVNRCYRAADKTDCIMLSNFLRSGGLSSSAPGSAFFPENKCYNVMKIKGDRNQALQLADRAEKRSAP